MGTYKLWELANSTDEVNILAQQVAEEMSDKQLLLRKPEWDETAMSFVFVLHRVMWNQKGKTADKSKRPFTHKVKGLQLRRAFFKAVPNARSLFSEREIERLVRSAYSILSNNNLLKRLGGSGSRTFFIREWPDGFIPHWTSGYESTWFSKKDEADLQRQDQKAKDIAGPVVVSYSLAEIPLPDPNPKAILAYVKKIVGAAKKLQSENNELRARVTQLESGEEWKGVVGQIKEALDT